MITSGGGYAPQGGGAGGGAGAGETPVQGSRVRSGYSPADRTTSIRYFAAKGKARGAFSKSGRGSKESPMSPGSWATPAGLSGLEGGVFGWIKDRLTPPGGDITRIQIIPVKVREFIPTPIRTAVRYAGAIPYTATVGLFTPAPVARKIFGLSPTESKYQEMGAKAARVTAAIVATAGAATYLTGAGPLVNAPVAGGYAPGLSPLSLGTTAAKPVFAANTAGYATPAMFGGSGTIFTGGTYVPASTSLFAASSSISPAMNVGLPLSGSGNLLATGKSIAGGFVAPPPLPPPSWLATTGGKLLGGTGEVLKAVGIQVGAQAIMASISKTPGAEAAQSYYGGEFGASPVAPLPAFVMPTSPSGGPSGGGESSGIGDAIAAGGYSPLIGLGLAGLGLALYLKKRKSNTWRTA